jgi:glycerol-3-phosphate acyltransferase PlsY
LTFELLIVVASYLLGSIPSALLVVWATTGADIRKLGSGNVGATNALRTAGWKVGVLVTVLDVGKGVIPTMAMNTYHPASRWVAAAAVAAVLGHCFPIWLGFRGGKGVATALGAFLVLLPWATLGAVGVWLLVLAVRRVVSLASVVAAAAFPVLVAFVHRPPVVVIVAASVVATVVLLRHIGNIRELISGREHEVD